MTNSVWAQAGPRPAPSRKEYFLVLAGIASLFLLLFGPTLQAQFYVVEDHQIITEHSWSMADWFTRLSIDLSSFGRFRPAYWLYHAMGSLLFGTNPHFWHATAILFGVLTCYLLYIALRKIGADVASSCIFVLLLVLSGNQNWIWVNLIPQETLGMLLTAIAVWAIVLASQAGRAGRWDVPALGAMALAGLVKESFVILIPALLLLRATCEKCFSGRPWRECLRGLRLPLTIGTLIFAIEFALVMTVLLLKPDGYSAKASGLSPASFDPRRWLRIVSTLAWDKQLLSAAGVLLWVSLWFDKKLNRTYLLLSAAIFAAWLVPQVMLYTNGLNERYLFPAIVCVAALIALGLTILWRKRLWPLWVVCVLLLVPGIVNGVQTTTRTVGWFTAETLAVNRMVTFLAQHIPAEQVILMAGDSGTAYGFEATYALPLYLKMAGAKSPFYLWPLVSKGERSPMHVAASNNNTRFRYPDSLTARDVGAIIIVDTFLPALDTNPLVDWLGDTKWQEINFTEPHCAFSISLFKFVASQVNHKILLPSSTGVSGSSSSFAIDPSHTALPATGSRREQAQ